MRTLGLKATVSALAVLVTALAAGGSVPPVAAQQTAPAPPSSAPKSLLPAGTFAPPPPPPVAEPAPAPESAPAGEAQSGSGETPEAGDGALAAPEAVPPEPSLPRSRGVTLLTASDRIGVHGPATGGFDETLWAGSSGPFLRDFMKGQSAPTASRWAHVLLRRALLSRTPTPQGVLPANFVAERAHLLLRMGEAEGARRLVAQVPVTSFTRRMFDVAPQAHLAAGDVAGLCPMVQTGITVSADPVWPLASAVCAALQGDDAGAALTLDRERENHTAKAFDIQLAEVVATTLAGGDRGVNAVWPQNMRLTTYRLAMALAGGVEVPRQRLEGANAAVKGWLVRLGAAPLAARLEAAPTAAVNGALPARELVDLWSLQASLLDETAIRALPVGKLRTAYSARTPEARLAAMRELWASARTPQERAAMLLVTADAARRLPVTASLLEAAPELGRALLLAGEVKAARAWYDLARREARNRNPKAGAALMGLWPLVAAADQGVPRSGDLFTLWDDMQDGERAERKRRRQLAGAALSGLGLVPVADLPRSARVEPEANAYVQRLREAAQSRRRGEVILLSAAGLGKDAAGVRPDYLHEITRALTAVGLRREAGLIAAEILIRNGA